LTVGCAAEYQRIFDHRGIEIASPLYALSYLGFARSLASTGNVSKSQKFYQDFFSLWKEADPGHPHSQTGQRRICEVEVNFE